jgi:hypothetical protein
MVPRLVENFPDVLSRDAIQADSVQGCPSPQAQADGSLEFHTVHGPTGMFS